MAYTPNEWSCGDIVTADKLNNIERGIAEVNSEYVPTSWQCGDLITAEAMNKIEQGIANASGGSSDFSTATVTIVNNSGMPIAVFGAIATEEDDEFFTIHNWSVFASDTIQVVMYKGLAYGGLDGSFSTVNTTGDISWNGDTLTITGDGTITISGGIEK